MKKLQKVLVLKILEKEQQRMILHLGKELKQYEYLVATLKKIQESHFKFFVHCYYFRCNQEYFAPF